MTQNEEGMTEDAGVSKETNASVIEEKDGNQNTMTLGVEPRETSLEVRNKQIVVAVCVALSLIFMKTGFLSFFFLAPLGYSIIVCGSFPVVFIAAAAANIFISVLTQMFSETSSTMLLDLFYFTTIILAFTWLVGAKKIFMYNVRISFRFILASAVGTIAFLIYVLTVRNGAEITSLLDEMSKYVMSIFVSNDDVSQLNFPPETIIEMMKSITLRGGAFISILSILYINYQLTFIGLRLIAKNTTQHNIGLMRFFAPRETVWVFLGALVTVILTSKIELLNILAWNVLTIAAVVFLAQGIGILLYQIAKRSHVIKMAAGISLLILLISPLNAIVIIGLLLLGIAETWLPLRVKKIIN